MGTDTKVIRDWWVGQHRFLKPYDFCTTFPTLCLLTVVCPFSIVLQYCLKCESTGKTLSTGPSPSRRFVCSSSDSTVRGVRMVDPRQCSVARAVIMEHYRILVSPASCRGRDTAAVGTGVSWLGNYTHAACSILVKILIKLNGHHSAIYSFL